MKKTTSTKKIEKVTKNVDFSKISEISLYNINSLKAINNRNNSLNEKAKNDRKTLNEMYSGEELATRLEKYNEGVNAKRRELSKEFNKVLNTLVTDEMYYSYLVACNEKNARSTGYIVTKSDKTTGAWTNRIKVNKNLYQCVEIFLASIGVFCSEKGITKFTDRVIYPIGMDNNKKAFNVKAMSKNKFKLALILSICDYCIEKGVFIVDGAGLFTVKKFD